MLCWLVYGEHAAFLPILRIWGNIIRSEGTPYVHLNLFSEHVPLESVLIIHCMPNHINVKLTYQDSRMEISYKQFLQ